MHPTTAQAMVTYRTDALLLEAERRRLAATATRIRTTRPPIWHGLRDAVIRVRLTIRPAGGTA